MKVAGKEIPTSAAAWLALRLDQAGENGLAHRVGIAVDTGNDVAREDFAGARSNPPETPHQAPSRDHREGGGCPLAAPRPCKSGGRGEWSMDRGRPDRVSDRCQVRAGDGGARGER